MQVRVTISGSDGYTDTFEGPLALFLQLNAELAAQEPDLIRALAEEGSYRTGGGATPIIDIEAIDSGIRLTPKGKRTAASLVAEGADGRV